MQESDFERLAEALLSALESALEEAAQASGAQVDIEAGTGGVLELEFQDGSKIIINRHSAAREIWVAAKSGGFHFRWDGAHWRDTRGDEDLAAVLTRLVSEHAGRRVELRL